MKTNDETVYGPVSQPKKEEKKQSQGWKTVSLGGVTGILMGGAGMYAANAYGAEGDTIEDLQTEEQAEVQETANGIKVAEVDQSMSFGEAFEAARQEVGAGGVFHWHGGIYNTYTAAEWNSMTPEEHNQFSQQVQPEIRKEEQHPYTVHHDTGLHHDQASTEELHQTTVKPSGQVLQTDNDDEPEEHHKHSHEERKLKRIECRMVIVFLPILRHEVLHAGIERCHVGTQESLTVTRLGRGDADDHLVFAPQDELYTRSYGSHHLRIA